MASEIERKFLVAEMPKKLEIKQQHEIKQAYLFSNADFELRVRKKSAKFYQTIKKGGDLVREETELEINQNQFEILWELAKDCSLEKIRYEIPWQHFVIELDIYLNNLKGLMTAEVEFESVKEAKNFTPPKWFGREITTARAYKNSALARNGLP